MSFAQPSYLWALLGLLVPIAIHLWSKKEAKTIKIGSVQLLSESKSRQSSSIQLNEWWLLLLRMVIISLVTVLMAKPQWYSKTTNTELTYIIEQELVQNTNFMSGFNDLDERAEIRILEKKFPLIEDDDKVVKNNKVQDYWSLASEMDALQTDSIIVFTNGYAKGLKGSRPETKHHINWIVLDSIQSKATPLIAYNKGNGLQLFTGLSNARETKVINTSITLDKEYALDAGGDSLVISKRDTSKKVPLVNENTIEVVIYYADSLASDRIYITAALKAVSIYLDREIKVTSQLDNETIVDQEIDLVVWLSYNSVPDSFNKTLLLREDTAAHSMIIAGERKNSFYLTKRITSENAIADRLAESLLDILDVNKEITELLVEVDHRSVSESELQTTVLERNNEKKQLASWNVNPYLWLILLLLLLVERFVAYKRKQ